MISTRTTLVTSALATAALLLASCAESDTAEANPTSPPSTASTSPETHDHNHDDDTVWRGFQKVVFQRLESSVPPIGKSPTGGGPPSSPSQAGPGMLDRFLRVVNLTQIRVPVQSHGHRRVQNPVDQRFRGDLVGNHLQPILGTQL